jgi:hypothetical protein
MMSSRSRDGSLPALTGMELRIKSMLRLGSVVNVIIFTGDVSPAHERH